MWGKLAESSRRWLSEKAYRLWRCQPARSGDERRGWLTRNLGRMRRGAQECSELIRAWHPDVVLMTGGYVAAPVAWAAYWAKPRVPLLIYLPDLTPGHAIQITSRLAQRVAVSFPEVTRHFGQKAVVTGYPVRADLFTIRKHEAWQTLGLSADLPVLLVFGGSRGARSINRAIVEALPELLQRCQVVHVTGQTDWSAVQAAVSGDHLSPGVRARYHAHAYLHDMVHARRRSGPGCRPRRRSDTGRVSSGAVARDSGSLPLCRATPGS